MSEAAPVIPASAACPVAPLARDRLRTLEGRAATLAATSAEGALFQVALALDEAECAGSYAEAEFIDEANGHLRRVLLLLWSVRRELERVAGVRGEEVLGTWHMGREFDPHAAVEAALAGARRRSAEPPEPPARGRGCSAVSS
jgi:hypothetical protein